METKASHVIVGAFVLGLLAILGVFALWLGGFQGREQQDVYRIYFSGSVTGLSPGNPVRYRGIPVGQVSSLSILPDDIERIEAIITVKHNTPIKTDTVARVDRPGVTGRVFVQLDGGSQEAPLLRDSVTDDVLPEIPSEPSTLEQLISQAPEIAAETKATISQLKQLFNAQNRRAVADTLQNMRKLSDGFAGSMKDVDVMISNSAQLMQDLRASVAGFKTITKNFEGNMDAMRKEWVGTMTSLRDASKSMATMSKSVNGVVKKAERPVVDFTSSGLYEMTQLIMEMRELIVNLNRISQQFERDPARFLFGDAQKGYEVNE